MNAKRLKQLRLARGLSLDALAAEMGGIITKQALSKYELGKSSPSPVVLNKLAAALGIKAAHLWSEPPFSVKFIAYRKGSGLLKGEQKRVESLVIQSLEDRIRLQDLTRQINGASLPIQKLNVRKVADAELAANKMREMWSLGEAPIANVTDMLEDHLIHVLEVGAGEKFDGISAVVLNGEDNIKAAAVVSRPGIAGERQRLNLAHELGHLVLNISKETDEEKAAFRFAAGFLVPAESLYKEVGNKRVFIQIEELLILKQRFGISVQALLYRLHDLGVIADAYYKKWCMDISRLRWKKHEPCELAPERPQWLRRSVLRALGEDLLAREEAEKMLGEPLKAKEPLSLIERRSFMKLPLEERRKLLAEQASKFEAYYGQNSETKGIGGGDIIDQ
ncbi:MAG TPA: XRE family transcriptional regulator [Candidatus Hodarchaeales archaeon]|nr:XRE family transcriptional regulator [Candidatus Hodarchaeales archaeon]